MLTTPTQKLCEGGEKGEAIRREVMQYLGSNDLAGYFPSLDTALEKTLVQH
ncbi:MAG: hypothetical protein QW291_01065 [Thermofilaceae archaeon]